MPPFRCIHGCTVCSEQIWRRVTAWKVSVLVVVLNVELSGQNIQ
jgi:hypothetical protein